ncbi:hypothetical protein DQ04_09911010 [Trypanosoma grayi]|uniref:hypothetical protein n=1 Tax=Trypanosoma grayi TaxID=71804 RepID=UPI0004F49622|nr:hypothetical protein DQ04_09911010 [Trypanosoma grayi]KEG07400.1 hypothetical protein DQ04_09911010 [Trypanosoma grayi]
MPACAAVEFSSASAEPRLRDDFLSQLRSSRFDGLLKLRKVPTTRGTAAAPGCRLPQKRSRGEAAAASDGVQGVTAACVLHALCGVSGQPLRGLELRHARLVAADVAPEERDVSCQDGTGNLTLCTLLGGEGLFSSLRTLDLECNDLRDEGIIRLCVQCLPRLPFLQCLFVASNDFGVPGLEAIVQYTEGWVCDALAAAPDGDDSGGGGGGGTNAASGGMKPHPLETVGLTNNLLYAGSDDATLLLGRLLQACRSVLRRVHLNHVQMPTSAATELLHTVTASSCVGERRLSGFPRLEAIYLKQNDVDKERFRSVLQGVGADAIARAFVL